MERTTSSFAALSRDLSFGLNNIRRQPLFAVFVATTLALGTGAASTVYSIASGVLWNVVPWSDPERIVVLQSQHLEKQIEAGAVPYPRYLDWKAQSQAFEHVVAFMPQPMVLAERGQSKAVKAAAVSTDLFDALALDPKFGRRFDARDAESGTRVAVLSSRHWRLGFGGDREIIGKTVELDGAPTTVVGVLDEDAWFPDPSTDVLVPLRETPTLKSRHERSLTVLGVLRSSADRQRAATEFRVLSERLAQRHPQTDRGWSVRMRPASDLVGGERKPWETVVLLSIAGAAVLLICCFNLAAVLLARATARQKEMAVRTALGATRRQLFLQLLSEYALLAVLSLPLCLLFARWTVDFLVAQVPRDMAWLDQILRVDTPVLLFSLVVTLVTVLVFGAMPALRGSRLDVASVLKSSGERGSSGGGQQRLRSALLVIQLSFSLMLIVGASLLVHSVNDSLRADPGFDMERLFLAPISLPQDRYAATHTWLRFERDFTARLAHLPGVTGAGSADSSLIAPLGPTKKFKLVGSRERDDVQREARWAAVSPGYFPALGVTTSLGRGFLESDTESSKRVAMVDETLVRQFLGGASPLGHRLALADGSEIEIVGVVPRIRQFGLGDAYVPRVYVPLAQQPSASLQVIARTTAEPLALVPSVRSVLRAIDGRLPVFVLTSLREAFSEQSWPGRMMANIMLLLGAVGAALAIVGLYGSVSYTTSSRSRELGIRVALGAEPRHIVRAVLRQTAITIGLGVAIGGLLSLGFGSMLASALYEVRPFDAPTFVLAATGLLAVALAAASIPAFRAAHGQPMDVLREE